MRISADDADRLDVIEGLRVRLALPEVELADGLVVRVYREPPFAWVELKPLAHVIARFPPTALSTACTTASVHSPIPCSTVLPYGAR